MQRSLVFLLVVICCPLFLLQPAVHAQTIRAAVAVEKKSTQTAKKRTCKDIRTTAPLRANKTTPKKAVSKPVVRKTSLAQATKSTQAAKGKEAGATSATTRHAAGKQTTSRVQKKKARCSPTSRSKAQPLPVPAPVQQGLPDIANQISARSVMVMDAVSGETIFAKMPDNPRQPASTIKIVTAMIAIESLKKGDSVEISRHAADMPSSKIFLEPSKTYRVDDLINAVLLASANDASVALAEKIAGTEEKFARLMTLTAKMWGARNTVCRTASGLTAVGQQSTARDLANLFRYAMQHDAFASRMREKFICTSYGKTLRNHNKALWRIDGAVGGKTGYTVAARQTYVGKFSRAGRSIVVAIMGSESMWADLGKLVEYGFKKKDMGQIARTGT